MRQMVIHPESPQPRLIDQAAQWLSDGQVLALPTDASYVFAGRAGDKQAAERIRRLHGVDEQHQLSLMCADLSELGVFAKVTTRDFRLIKALTPGPYTFLLPATREVPRRLQEPKKRSIGLRIPANPIVLALLAALQEPLVVATARLAGEDEAMTEGWEIVERAGHALDAVIDGGAGSLDGTTILDLLGEAPEVVRLGIGPVTFL